MKKRSIIALLVSLVMLISSVLAMAEDITQFAAGNVTLSGTITLPTGYSASVDNYVDIFLTGIITEGAKRIDPTNGSSTWYSFDLSSGQKSFSYSITAPKGTYYLGIEPYISGLSSSAQYYTASGTVNHEMLADVIDLTSNKTINATISAPERTISGTITLDEPAYENGYIWLDFEPMGGGSDSYVNVEVSEGQTSVDYKAGVSKGTYSIYTDNGYYSIYNDLNDDYETRYYLNTENSSVSNINFTFPADYVEYYGSGSGGSTARQRATFNLKLPSGITTEHSFRLRLIDSEGGFTRNVFFTAEPGQTNVTSTAYIYSDDSFYISTQNNLPDTYYYNKDTGFTKDMSAATLFTYASTYTVDMSKLYSVISGTVSRNGMNGNEYLRFGVNARVELPTQSGSTYNQVFSDYIAIEHGASSAPYSILLPADISDKEAYLYISYNSATRNAGKSVPAQSGTCNLSFPADCTKKVSGTVRLTSPAPKGGVAVSFNDLAYYVIPQGSSSVNFDVYADASASSLNVYTTSEDSRYDELWETTELASDSGVEITIPIAGDSKTVSGTLRIADPSAMTNAVSYRLYVDAGSDNYYVYGTIPKGSSYMTYSVNVPDNTTEVSVRIDDIYSGDMVYLQPSDYYNIEMPASGKLNNMDFVLADSVKISFTAKNLPDLSDVTAQATIELNNGVEKTVYFDESGKATVELDADDVDYADYFTVYFLIDGEDGEHIYDYGMYINPDGSLVNRYEVESYPIASTNITFTVYDNSILLNEDSVDITDVSYDNESGEVTITYDNIGGTAYNAAAVIAVYDAANALTYTESELITLTDANDPVVLSTELGDNMPEGGQAVLYLWNNLSLLKPIKTAETIYTSTTE